jgi:hypothetical protein
LNWTPVQYRKFKSSGTAHQFQQQISNRLFDQIDFKKVPGKALHQMVNVAREDGSTFIERHNIDMKYLKWIKSQPVAKFTGYVYELMKTVSASISLAQKHTVDKQFEGLIRLAEAEETQQENVWCALDTSGSMQTAVADTTAFDICISLGVYFSTLIKGAFQDHVIMFDKVSRVKKLSGTFSDKVLQLTKEQTAWGSTNFQSVIDTIVKMRRIQPDIPIADYPTTLVVVSDMQFNPAGSMKTNYETAMRKLKQVGLSEIRIVWWWVTGRGQDFPSTLDDKGTILIGGFDGTIISQLIGKDVQSSKQDGQIGKVQSGPYEAMQRALDQEVLNLLEYEQK